MKITIEILNRIEKYLAGSMIIEEEKLFEKEIQNSSELKQLVEEQKIERQKDVYPQFKMFVLDGLSKENLELNSILEPSQPSANIILWYKRPIFRYAASILLFLGIGYVAFNYFQKSTLQKRELLASQFNESKQYADDNKAIKEDTSFTSGQDFRIKFFENDFPFQSNLNNFTPKNKYEEQCKQYWQAWYFMSEKNYESALNIFEKLWKELPEGILHQKVAVGLMKSLLLTKNDDRLKEVVEKTIAEQESYPEALKFAKEVKSLLKL